MICLFMCLISIMARRWLVSGGWVLGACATQAPVEGGALFK
jgi:hypothetical protein